MSLLPWLAVMPVAALTAHTIVNAALLRRPPDPDSDVDAAVSVLLPVRDEAHRVGPCLAALLAQRHVPRLEIVVLDDGSTDATVDVVRDATRGDVRVHLVTGAPLPSGWLGKPYACHQAAAASTAPLLVFVDADTVLAPTAVATAVKLLRDFHLACPYPRITGAGRLIQPLLQWSWLTFLPLRAMERSPRPSLAAAGGQFLAVRRDAYDRAGGHAAVRDQVLEDIALARSIKRCGGRITLADGSRLATTRMYESWSEVVAGYTKSLWASFRTPCIATAVATLLLLLYAVAPLVVLVAVIVGSWSWAAAGLATYLLAVAGRAVAAASTGGRVWPDVLAHPASVVILVWLLARSYRHRRQGRLSWKGRLLRPPRGSPP